MTESNPTYRRCPSCGKRFEAIRHFGSWSGNLYLLIPEHKQFMSRELCPGSGKEGLTKRKSRRSR